MRIGIDLGGTKIEGVLMDRAGRIRERRRRPTPVAAGYGAILSAICDLVTELEQTAGRECPVGIGTPGALSAHNNTLKNSNTVCMNGRPVKADLEERLNRLLRIENDANCFALSEALDGAAQGYGMVFGVIMGTGVGGGLVHHRVLHAGLQHIAGEWGHNILVPGGRQCYCGRHGCVETYLSGPGLMCTWREVTGSTEAPSPQTIAERTDAGEPDAGRVMGQFLKNFGQALSVVINILDPDAVVIGGGLSNIENLYVPGHEYVARYVFNDELRTPILKNCHGDSSGVRGAAQLWPPDGTNPSVP